MIQNVANDINGIEFAILEVYKIMFQTRGSNTVSYDQTLLEGESFVDLSLRQKNRDLCGEK